MQTTKIRPPAIRRSVPTLVLIAFLLGLGIWGMSADRSTPPTIGDSVQFDGGTARVAEVLVLGDPMAGMHSGSNQFANLGMSMSQMLPDAVPEGMKRIAIQIHFVSGLDNTMTFPAYEFSLVSDGVEFRPYRSLLGDEFLAPGEQLDGVVVFEIPQSLQEVQLSSPRLSSTIRFNIDASASHAHSE